MTETQATAPNGRWIVWVWRDSSGVDEITGPLDGDPAPFYYDGRSSDAPSIQSIPISRAHMRATCAPFHGAITPIDIAIVYMTAACLVGQIWSFQNEAPSFLCVAASGIGTKAVGSRRGQQLGLSSGMPSL